MPVLSLGNRVAKATAHALRKGAAAIYEIRLLTTCPPALPQNELRGSTQVVQGESLS